MAATYTSTLVATVSGSLVPTATETIVAPLAAPSGYVVDFDHPERKGDVDGYWVHAFGIIFALGFLAMRVYVKTRITPPLNWEDGTLDAPFSACPLLTSNSVLLILGWVSQDPFSLPQKKTPRELT